jgi:putative hemolysin
MIGSWIVFVVFSAWVTATRTALHLTDRERLPDNAQLRQLLEERNETERTLLLLSIGTNVGVAFTTFALLSNPVIAVVATALVVLVLTELLPRGVAVSSPQITLRISAWPAATLHQLVFPARRLLGSVGQAASTSLGIEASRQPALDENDVLELLHRGAAQGAVDDLERDLIESVFDFDDVLVERLMTPRPEMFSVPLDISWDELMNQLTANPFSRIPVYDGRSDDVIGVLLLKDLLRYRETPLKTPAQLRRQLLPPVFVPTSKKGDDMLEVFMEMKQHMAFVVDEHGTLVGLVTISDLLDELIGDIDTTPVSVRRVTSNVFHVDATVDIDDLAEETGLVLPAGEYHTVGGFISATRGELPEEGDEVAIDNARLVVRRMDERRIAEVTVYMGPANREAM